MSDVNYKSAGVDLDLYRQAMTRLPEFMRRTHAAHPNRVIDLPGGFAGLFRLQDERHRYTDPVLVSGTDGVGTKLKVATRIGVHDTVGIDLVAMCVNDCLCLGAEPLFFLDYLALGRDDPALIAELVKGVGEGCLQARAALLGGETAVMPDVYADGEYDLAGFCVGVVERDRLIDGSRIAPRDVLLGLPSSGFHSNGYSLIRKVVFELAKLNVDDPVTGLDRTVGQVLLEPTRIYAEPLIAVLETHRDAVHGIAHITGGGLEENLERILPEGCRVKIDRRAWDVPACFGWLQDLGRVDRDEMFRVFNMGIGLVLTVPAERADAVRERVAECGLQAVALGEVAAGDRGVEFVD